MVVEKQESKSQEEALNKCLAKLNCMESECFYYFEETESGLFKSKRYVCYAITKYDVKEFLKDYLNGLASKMGTKFDVEIDNTEVGFSILLDSPDSAALIGKDGHTLNSLRWILMQVIHSFGNFNIKINLDVANYRRKKEKYFERDIKKMCFNVLKTKMDLSLDPMNSYDRRLVHNVVASFADLSSVSEGEEPERHVIIKYKESD